MTFSQLLKVLAETGLSPEQLAPKLGVANMTIRRWKDERGSRPVPKAYERSVVEGIYQLVIEGHLKSDSTAVQECLVDASTLSFQAALKSLSITEEVAKGKSSHEDKMAIALYQIGASEKRKSEVDGSRTQLNQLKKMGEEWKTRISTLVEVVQSTKLSSIDKLVAYGALFYLICPFDLIPDHIPLVGYVDDFGILGFAVAFYLRKFPNLFSG